MTEVTNLTTLVTETYDLPPAMAVCAAHQHSVKNNNTWTYHTKINQVVIGVTTVSMGDWAANLYTGADHKAAVKRLAKLVRHPGPAIKAEVARYKAAAREEAARVGEIEKESWRRVGARV